jgi:catalase
LLEAAGVTGEMDGGYVPFRGADDADTFVTACRNLRFWEREASRHSLVRT